MYACHLPLGNHNDARQFVFRKKKKKMTLYIYYNEKRSATLTYFTMFFNQAFVTRHWHSIFVEHSINTFHNLSFRSSDSSVIHVVRLSYFLSKSCCIRCNITKIKVSQCFKVTRIDKEKNRPLTNNSESKKKVFLGFVSFCSQSIKKTAWLSKKLWGKNKNTSRDDCLLPRIIFTTLFFTTYKLPFCRNEEG